MMFQCVTVEVFLEALQEMERHLAYQGGSTPLKPSSSHLVDYLSRCATRRQTCDAYLAESFELSPSNTLLHASGYHFDHVVTETVSEIEPGANLTVDLAYSIHQRQGSREVLILIHSARPKGDNAPACVLWFPDEITFYHECYEGYCECISFRFEEEIYTWKKAVGEVYPSLYHEGTQSLLLWNPTASTLEELEDLFAEYVAQLEVVDLQSVLEDLQRDLRNSRFIAHLTSFKTWWNQA